MNRAIVWAIAGTAPLLSLPLSSASAEAQSIVPAADGTGTQVSPVDGNYTITGGTTSGNNQNLFHSFTEFNVLTGESATFTTDPAILNILSRVNGGNASLIDGLLQVSGSNANLFFINPNGILFGPNAVLNVQGSFTAVTADQVNFATGAFGVVGTPDYAALTGAPQSFSFNLENPGSVVNAGTLSVAPNESVVLIGGQVLNLGTIAAPGGEVVISAVEGGNRVRIEQTGALLSLELETLAAGVTATGLPFSPLALPELLTSTAIAPVNQVTVNSDGTVQLASGEPINPNPAAATVSGTVAVASATQGGEILVLGREVALRGATLDASGELGGGTVRGGGDYQGQGPLPAALSTLMDSASTINADAIASGNGGTIILWADGDTVFAGDITARGGTTGGDGGFVETSGAGNLVVAATASVDARAVNGTAGNWLLDPTDLEVVAAGGTAGIVGGTNDPVTATTIDAGVIVAALNGNDVTLLADNSITVNAAIDATINTGPGNLTLTALTINLNEDITLSTFGFPVSTLTGSGEIINVGPNGSLLDALEVAIAGATINLAAATYQEGETISITQDVTLQGAGAGSTILDGQNGGYSVVEVFSPSIVTISDLTITKGTVLSDGAGIFNLGSDLTLLDVVVANNTAQQDLMGTPFGGNGGGIFSSNGTVTLIRTEVTGNTAEGDGGGILNNGGTLLIQEDSAITTNTAGGDGGGLWNGEGIAFTQVLDSIISKNTAAGDGGGIFNDETLIIRDLTLINENIAGTNGGGISNFGEFIVENTGFSSNQAAFGGGINHSGTDGIVRNNRFTGNAATGEFGGGAIGSSGQLLIQQSTFTNNTANQGGALFITSNTLDLNRSTLNANTASDRGGGIFNAEGTVNVNTSTLSANQITGAAGGGGGIFNAAGTVNIDNSTIAFNSISSSAGRGGGIDAGGGSLFLTSSLITGNNAFTSANIAGPFISRGNNLIGANSQAGAETASLKATDIVPVVALNRILNAALASNGGPTQTHALVANSPAIDAGSGTAADQRGANVVNGIRDIGAFEFIESDSPGSGGGSGSGSGSGTAGEQFFANQDNESVTTIVDDFGETDLPNDTTAAAFRDHLAVAPRLFEDFDVLERAATLTNVPPALIYARFVSDANEFAVTQAIDPDKALEQRARELIAQAETQPNPGIGPADDVLELVLVMPNGEPRRFSTGATRAQVMQAAQQLQSELTDRTRRRLDTYLQPAQALYGWLLAPVEDALEEEGIGHVSFVLDQGLRSVPLAALHDGKQFIIERYSVGLMPSLTLTDTRIGNVQNASVLAMGASEFTDQPPLPAVPVELAAIEATWPGSRYLNETFTPETIVQARQENPYRILHLATHGQFNSGALSNSYIQFWNRRLTLDQLPQLGLGEPTVELLVLSACRTVLGSEEAELGFAGVAVKSGAKSAIAALWQVSDLETAGLMAELYTQLGQVSYKAAALQQAQLAMLRGEITVQDGYLTWSGGQILLPEEFRNLTLADTRHPYYWSAFTLVGSLW